MQNTTDKVVEGVVYERVDHLSGVTANCKQCVANRDGNGLCNALSDEHCAFEYTFKVKDVQKYSKVIHYGTSSPLTASPTPLQKASEPSQGCKYDDGKTLYSLVPPYALEAVAKNLTVGLQKYPARDNWMLVDNAQGRYLDALYRHLEAHRRGEIYDTENTDPTTTHLSAVAVNSLFLLELMLNPSLRDTNGTT